MFELNKTTEQKFFKLNIRIEATRLMNSKWLTVDLCDVVAFIIRKQIRRVEYSHSYSL